MVKIKRDFDKVYPKAVYAWSYYTPYTYRHVNSITKKSFYRKKYCQVPFYSRVHAKHVLTTMYGVDALRYVHFISGKKLRSQGMKVFKQQKYPHEVLFGEKGIYIERYISSRNTYGTVHAYHGTLKMYIYPPEYQYDKHRRRHFTVALHNKRKKGIAYFNKWYKSQFYGSRSGISKTHLRAKRKEVNDALLQEIPSLKPTSSRYRTGDI